MTSEALLETIPRVVYNHDLSGNFTFINETGERLSGYSREEICRMNLVEIVAPEIAGHICEQVIREATRNVGTVYEIEIIAKGGQRVPLEVSTRTVLREGEPIGIEGIGVPSLLHELTRQQPDTIDPREESTCAS